MLSGVHTDAVSVFGENGGLVLATKADVNGAIGVRLVPEQTLFHVEQRMRTTIPDQPDYSFLGSPGAEVWIASENNPSGKDLWPGFSTEGVPSGMLDGNRLTLRLESVSGPGTVHIYQSGTFGEPKRLLSSTDPDFRSWTLPRGTHAHASWAFSAAGGYTLTFSVEGFTNGASLSATQSYAFIVGDLPTPTATLTTLAATTTSSLPGSAVLLHSTVAPNHAAGWVEFIDGTTVLGHDLLTAGSASLATTNLPLGERSLIARFIPEWLNDFSSSTSAPVVITNTDSGGLPFTLAGVAGSYRPGDTLTATAFGLTLQPGQWYRWQWRSQGSTDFELSDPTDDPVFSRVLSASDDGYELRVSVWLCEEWDEYCNSEPVLVAESAWAPVIVASLGDPIIAQLLSPVDAFIGDMATFSLHGPPLDHGERLELVRRSPATGWHTWSNDVIFLNEGATITALLEQSGEYAVRLLTSDGLAVAQSAPVAITVNEYEVQIAAVQGLYRPGATLQAHGIIHPESPGLLYRWSFFVPGGMPYRVLKEGYGAEALTLDIPDLMLAHNGGVLFLTVFAPVGPPLLGEDGLMQVGERNVRVYVQDSDPDLQILRFQPLSDHYHQGNVIPLVLAADPPPALGDLVVWEWRWPGTEWTDFPGSGGLSRSLVAEQALDGLQVRTTLRLAATNTSITAEPVTILVDDHGAAPRQQPSVTGPGNVVAGEPVTLTRQLPANGPTMLTTHLWERMPAGASDFSPVAGTTGASLSFTATLADDGSAYRVTILKPDGAIAYGPSPSVTLRVTPADSPDFSITGIERSYLPGDIMEARVAGLMLKEGQEIQWRLRPVGTDFSGTILSRFVPETANPDARAGRLNMRLDASYDGYELQAAVMQGDQAVATTGWTGPVSVADSVEPLSLEYVGPTPFRLGDTASLIATGRELADGESLRIVLNARLSHFNLWTVGSGYHPIQDRTFAFEPQSNTSYPLALQVIRDGLVVAQSETLEVDFSPFDFLFEGVQAVYRPGQTFNATITVLPDLGDRVTYSWAMYDDYENPVKVARGEDGRTFSMPVTAELDGKRMFIQAKVAYASGNTALIGGAYPYLTVTDDPSAQLFLFSSLPDHYHQGSPVDLLLFADPGPAEGDAVAWEWRWPGMAWEALPQAEGLSHQLTAEQAMDGLEVRATLNFADSGSVPIAAGPVTIRVNDHGAAPLQQPTIVGVTSRMEGEPLALTRHLPANGPTILVTHRWERKPPGASEFSPVPDATGATVSFPSTLADDGAEYRVSILKPDGSVAYGPSPSIVITVRPRDLNLVVANGNATLSLATRSGVVQVLESATAVAGPWVPLGDPVQGNGQTVQVVVPVREPVAFFRWRVVD